MLVIPCFCLASGIRLKLTQKLNSMLLRSWVFTPTPPYPFLGVGCLHPLPLTLSFTAPPPKNHPSHPLTLARHAHRFRKLHRKIRLSSGWNFERRSRSREPVVETAEHCFRSPLVARFTYTMSNRVCSSCLWHPRPAISFARRILWLESDGKGGGDHETSIPISSLEDSRGAPVRDDYPCDTFSPDFYPDTFMIDHLGQVQ